MKESDIESWLTQVGDYYDKTNDLWTKHMGNTIQAGMLTKGAGPADVFAHNVFTAKRAGIQPGLPADFGKADPTE